MLMTAIASTLRPTTSHPNGLLYFSLPETVQPKNYLFYYNMYAFVYSISHCQQCRKICWESVTSSQFLLQQNMLTFQLKSENLQWNIFPVSCGL